MIRSDVLDSDRLAIHARLFRAIAATRAAAAEDNQPQFG